MRLEYLYYFKHLAETLNFTKAARDLFIAQPTLSAAIKRMEKDLGFMLFKREGNRVVLSEAGKAFLDYVTIALASYERGVSLAQEYQGVNSQEIKVGAIYAIQDKFFSQALLEFSQQYSPVPHIMLDQGYSATLVEELRNGSIDVAFASKLPETDDLNFTLCWSQPIVVGVNVGHPLAKRKSVSLDELQSYELLTYNEESPVYENAKLLVDNNGLHAHYECNNEVTMASLVSSNPAYMALFCYSFLVNAFDGVVCLPIEDVPADFHKIYLVSRKERHPKIVQEFLDFIGQYHFPSGFTAGS